MDLPSKHKTFVWHFYSVGPTLKTLGRRCTNVIQMFWFAGEIYSPWCDSVRQKIMTGASYTHPTTSQQTQKHCITFVHFGPTSSTLYICYTNVLCLLGYLFYLLKKSYLSLFTARKKNAGYARADNMLEALIQ